MTDPRIIPTEIATSSVNGITALLWVISGILVGMLLIVKYLKYKDKTLLLVGTCIIILPSPWWSAAFGYVLALFGIYLENISYGIMLLGPLTIDIFIWLYVVSDALYKEKQKLIMLLIGIYVIISEILIISLSFLNVNDYIMVRMGLIDIRFQLPLMVMNLILSTIFIITFILYALPVFRSEDPETHLKGKLAFWFLILFMIGNVMDAIIPWDLISNDAQISFMIESSVALIARITLIVAIFCLYNVFVLLKVVKKKLLN